jgi:hypothetical protein
MSFYKVVLRPAEGPVFNSTKYTVLLMNLKKQKRKKIGDIHSSI